MGNIIVNLRFQDGAGQNFRAIKQLIQENYSVEAFHDGAAVGGDFMRFTFLDATEEEVNEMLNQITTLLLAKNLPTFSR